MATNEKITLNVDLYDNIMTEQKGDYTGRARITGSLHNKEIAARIIKERTEYRQETIENILDLADQKKVEAIAERGRRCGTVHRHRTWFVPRGERPV